MAVRMHEDEVDVSADLVRRLLAAQLPHLADRPLAVVEPWGTDNGVWRLGDDLVVRLPRIHWAADRGRSRPDRRRSALAVWDEALAADRHHGPPVWVQGDLEGNCLVRDGRLCGIVDWGSACVGYPLIVERAWHKLAALGIARRAPAAPTIR